MPLLLIPLLIGALLFGAFRLYANVAGRFGAWAGACAVLAAAAILVGLAVYAVHRHRRYHGKTVGGRRVLELSGDWGRLTLDAGQKHGRLALDDQEARFIFADIAGVSRTQAQDGHGLVLQLRHDARGEWRIPMADGRQARRWARILALAADQRL
ncbi:MAG: hypothetical protein WBF84_14175 [Castellaniella sp.]|uniref:hypothetical protein n=1 Tax=Castellaniella sp. TaxID=1955812 RepID=UPI003C7703B9